ncbi:winged helix-turn-helix domain-containing protein [Hyperthermus butylicus]|uniref:HTH arsR-type domain-containing protein n=1 Tax=Hyperthermus butylicus (strain DSM 5456 / JCM 9403 / PLM1-5) TaxID=415426 RepID=A2BKP6_HYPBU|nr:helix-turn-helix domain-containing protein [Hyperthermus butylicus]ABM80557.1 hypothetical protein Hbut_0702 [Hyperthermus butylicus DSM 5456]
MGEELDTILQALSHPTRRCIVRVLGEKEEASYAELMQECGVNDSGTFAFHLRRLQGIVEKMGEGSYRLTGLGRRAYEVLLALMGEGRLSTREQGGWDGIVYGGSYELWLTGRHLDYAESKHARIVIRDVDKLVIASDVEPERFDKLVESIEDVDTIIAPRKLAPMLEAKARDYEEIRYYDGLEPPVRRGFLEKLAGIASWLQAPKRTVLLLEESVDPGDAEELRLEARGCAVKVQSSAGDKLVVRLYGRRGSKAQTVVSRKGGAVLVSCPEGVRDARLEIDVPPSWRPRLTIEAKAAAVKAHGLAVAGLEASCSASALSADVEIAPSSSQPVLKLIGKATSASVKARFEPWRGEALAEIDASASAVRLEASLPRGTAISLEPTRLDYSSAVKLVADGRTVRGALGYREEDGERRLRIRLSGSASAVKIVLNRAG